MLTGIEYNRPSPFERKPTQSNEETLQTDRAFDQPLIDENKRHDYLSGSEKIAEHFLNQDESKVSFKAPSEKSKTSDHGLIEETKMHGQK